ncbi:hypothetical protein [Micromonospora sp. NPDC049679]|uniref:hypothetical protein n=1 Tax=Micromonospora sp. NPDC049679 TaxID=3155920 RepID=UPI00340DA376
MDEEEGIEEDLLETGDPEAVKDSSAEKPADLLQLAERAANASIPVEWKSYVTMRPNGDVTERATQWYLHISLPGGGKDRKIFSISRSRAGDWASSNFESLVLLKDFAAALDRSTNVIEALVRPRLALKSTLQMLHRKARHDDAPDELKSASPAEDTLVITSTSNGIVANAEISPVSAGLGAAEGTRLGFSLKVRLNSALSYDASVKLLEEFSAALFFEMDLLYDLPLSLSESGRQRIRSDARERPPENLKAPTVPRNFYSVEAASLYAYGRSASGMPLLQYLAFYQVLEFYFPTYARSETVRRFQRRLRDPAFDPNNENQVATLVTFLNAEARALQYEEEQLKATVDSCIDSNDLRSFLEQSEARKEFLTKKNALKGVGHLVLDEKSNAGPLTSQVASRVYQIRCRIVHAKEDGGPKRGELLLPNSAEAKMLQHDISLVRWIAQRALIQAAIRSNW